jgi:hypothetical protein
MNCNRDRSTLCSINPEAPRAFRRRWLAAAAVLAGCAVWFNSFAPDAKAQERRPAMHHALFELQEARTEMKNAAHDFGGHREKALLATDAAIKQIEIALEAKGDGFKGLKGRDASTYKGYAHYPHIHHAIHELKRSRDELMDAKHDYGGHREKALKDVNYAIEQLELALKFAKK